MSWLSQFSLIMRSSVTTIREKVEDPERMLHQILIDMEDELDRTRSSVAESIADEIQMKQSVDRHRNSVSQWQRRAEHALAEGDEASAKVALKQKLECKKALDAAQAGFDRQASAVAELKRNVQSLEDKIRDAKHKKTLLLAQLATSSTQQKIQTTIHRTNSSSAMSQFNRLEARLDREQAMVEAREQLEHHDGIPDRIDHEFETREAEDRLNAELEELKTRVDR